MTNFIAVDSEPCTVLAGTTTTLAWQVWIAGELVASPWKARCQVRTAATDDSDLLDTWTTTIADGVVHIPLTADETAALVWRSGVIGVEVYDDTVSPEVVYRVVQAPIKVVPEVVR